MFLVRRASEVMARDVLVLPAETDFAAFLNKYGETGGLKHIVVTHGTHICGVLRVNTACAAVSRRRYKGVKLGAVAQHDFTIARQDDIVFDVVTRMSRRNASMAIVTKASGRPRAADVIGIISKEHIADSVADSIKPYGS